LTKGIKGERCDASTEEEKEKSSNAKYGKGREGKLIEGYRFVVSEGSGCGKKKEAFSKKGLMGARLKGKGKKRKKALHCKKKKSSYAFVWKEVSSTGE